MEPCIAAVPTPSVVTPFIPPPGIKPGQERDPKTGKLVARKRPELGTDLEPELVAMEWVITHSSDVSNQHAYYRRLWEKEPKYFAELLKAARSVPGVGGEGPGEKAAESWDGVGACPCCGHEPEVEQAAEPVEDLIGVLLEGGVSDGNE